MSKTIRMTEQAGSRPRTLLALEQVSSSLKSMLNVYTDVKGSPHVKTTSFSKAHEAVTPSSPLSPLSDKSHLSIVPSLRNNPASDPTRNSTAFEASIQAPSTPSVAAETTSTAASASTEQTRSWWLVTRSDRTERVSMSADTVSSPQTPSLTPRTHHSAISSTSTKRSTMDVSPVAREEFFKLRESKEFSSSKVGLSPEDGDPLKLKTSWFGRIGAGWRRSATSIEDLQSNAELVSFAQASAPSPV